MNRAKQLLDKFSGSELAVGGHVFFTDASISEEMACWGYDFIWIDAEHGPFDKEKILQSIVAANNAGAAAIVRVTVNDPAFIKPVLEMGPDGVISPMVCTREEAQRFADACLYPPKGARGFGPRRANRYGAIPSGSYLENASKSFLRIAQIEHVKAVENLEEIFQVDGIDAYVVGPNDLSGSIGRLGDTQHPEVVALFDEIAQKCKAAGKIFGTSIGPNDRQYIRDWIARGIHSISCGDDISFIANGTRDTIAFIKGCR